MTVKIGCDPELFFENQDGLLISSIGKVGGSKMAPKSIGYGCAVQEDNVAVEFNIPPSDTVDKFLTSVNFNLEYLTIKASQMGLKLAIKASGIFSEDELAHPDARIFGCDPDFNTWTKKMNPSPRAKDANLRSCGGHIHFGTDELHLNPWSVGRAADLFLGVQSLEFDKDTARRELYGKAGAVRIKPYGVEYRTLSNFWLKSEKLMRWVYHQSERAVEFVKAGHDLSPDEGALIQECINTSNVNLMFQLKGQYGL